MKWATKKMGKKDFHRIQSMRWFRKRNKQYISKRQKGIYYVYDTKLKQIIWKSEDKQQNESLIERLNNGYGFNGKYLAFSITYKMVDITIITLIH